MITRIEEFELLKHDSDVLKVDDIPFQPYQFISSNIVVNKLTEQTLKC
jgi:hypothetical protein